MEVLLDLVLGLSDLIRPAIAKHSFAQDHVRSQLRVWDWDPCPPHQFPLENVYRLKSTRKGRKRHFMKHVRMCFELLNVAKKQDFSLQPSKQMILLFMGRVPVQKLLWC